MAIDELTYPQPVRDRSGPAPSALAAAAAVPRRSPPVSYVFAFALKAGANQRSTTSSPRLRGPSIIRALVYAKGGTPDGQGGIALGKSASSVTETNVATTTARPYTSLFAGLPATVGVVGSPNDTSGEADMQTTILSPNPDLGIIVLDTEWFLTITTGNIGGTGDQFSGYVTVLDQVPLETLENFR